MTSPRTTEPNHTEQYNEFLQHYASLSEAELHDLALSAGDLTETAQQALGAEYRRRGLPQPTASAVTERDGTTHEGDPLEGFATDAPAECVFEFNDLEDAVMAQTVLRSAGIPSVVPTSEIGAVDRARLIVGPSDAQAAEMLLARPNALGTVSAEDAMFPETVCPECGTPDPLLESVEPTNQWRCESCGHTWEDRELLG